MNVFAMEGKLDRFRGNRLLVCFPLLPAPTPTSVGTFDLTIVMLIHQLVQPCHSQYITLQRELASIAPESAANRIMPRIGIRVRVGSIICLRVRLESSFPVSLSHPPSGALPSHMHMLPCHLGMVAYSSTQQTCHLEACSCCSRNGSGPSHWNVSSSSYHLGTCNADMSMQTTHSSASLPLELVVTDCLAGGDRTE